MTIDLYFAYASGPSRNVLLVAKAIGLDLNLKLIDLFKGEHLTPEYLKMNPQHNVPTLVDNGFILLESRAMMTYLVSKYAKDDSLYPKDVQKRAVVDQRLYFDIGTLNARFADYYYPVILGTGSLQEDRAKKLEETFQVLDLYLGRSVWAAGDTLTLADIALVVTVSTVEACGWDVSKYPNIVKWMKKCKTAIPGYEEYNQKGVDIYREMYRTAKNRK